jgi:hypothetical protein
MNTHLPHPFEDLKDKSPIELKNRLLWFAENTPSNRTAYKLKYDGFKVGFRYCHERQIVVLDMLTNGIKEDIDGITYENIDSRV